MKAKSGGTPITVYAAIASNAVIAAAKLIVATITRSSAMIAEGVHSMVDTGDQVLLLVGVHRSRRPPDAQHPFGHGMELYFWSLIVAMILFTLGGGPRFMKGSPIYNTPPSSRIPSPDISCWGSPFWLKVPPGPSLCESCYAETRGAGGS